MQCRAGRGRLFSRFRAQIGQIVHAGQLAARQARGFLLRFGDILRVRRFGRQQLVQMLEVEGCLGVILFLECVDRSQFETLEIVGILFQRLQHELDGFALELTATADRQCLGIAGHDGGYIRLQLDGFLIGAQCFRPVPDHGIGFGQHGPGFAVIRVGLGLFFDLLDHRHDVVFAAPRRRDRRVGLRLGNGSKRHRVAEHEVEAESGDGQHAGKREAKAAADHRRHYIVCLRQRVLGQTGLQFDLAGLKLALGKQAIGAVGLHFLHLIPIDSDIDVTPCGLGCGLLLAQQGRQHEGERDGDAGDGGDPEQGDGPERIHFLSSRSWAAAASCCSSTGSSLRARRFFSVMYQMPAPSPRNSTGPSQSRKVTGLNGGR